MYLFKKTDVKQEFSHLKTGFWALALLLIFSLTASADTDPANVPIGVNEHLGKTINMNYSFVDEHGDTVTIAELVDKPTVFSFVYYTCPGICSPLLSGLQESLNSVKLEPGRDFKVITISINEDEDHILAQEKKNNYFQRFDREFPEDQWHWLTGDLENINGITSEVGFAFERRGDDFAHSAALVVVSKDGKIARYLHGVDFNPFDLKMALLEAGEGRTGPTIAKVIKFCFSYDPEGRKYYFNFLRVTGSITLLFATVFFVMLIVKSKSKRAEG
ncbi:MAG: SCO family protein [Calditrichia bacterium]|nr:SCO family protein [Calditrichia bacterium]